MQCVRVVGGEEEEPSCPLLLLSSKPVTDSSFLLRRLQELEVRWQEYYELVTLLLQWIRHHVVIFGEQKFPTSFEEIEVRSLELCLCCVSTCVVQPLRCELCD